ncbi:MAG: TetR/AcrR family transcriptional regulator [Acidimicrobiales bacterium]
MTTSPAPDATAAPTPTTSRDRLLAGAATYISRHGFADVSLRELATALGTSHRMLLYHFGSKQQLFVDIIRSFETEQRLMIEAFAADTTLSRAEVMRRVWRQVSAPEAADQVRLFFQVCGQALTADGADAGLLEGIISDWLEPMVAVERARGAPAAQARAEVRVGVALMRGLLLDLLASGDRRGVDAAFERFLATSVT